MGWVVAILIVALLGNLYLFSGYDVDGDIATFMVGIAVLVDLLIIGYVIYLIVDKLKSKARDVSNAHVSSKKQEVINELTEQLKQKQEILTRFENYYNKKQHIFKLGTLISSCDNNNPRNLIGILDSFESSSFERLKTEIFAFLIKEEKSLFPTTINDFPKYKKKLDKDISFFKERISSVASADKLKVNEIIQETCPKLNKENRKRKIKLIVSCLTVVTIIISIIITAHYTNNAPYRELQSKIDNQSLTVEMVEWKNRDSENSYYEYLHSEKGYKFLADVFTELHRNNEIEKALWLLCVQPDCIDGIDLCASDSFIDWVVNYAKQNGTKKEQSDGDITYYVNDYEISISSIFDYSIGHTFRITNGKESTSVEKRNPYHDGSVPTIK